jgi:hypothetical protein
VQKVTAGSAIEVMLVANSEGGAATEVNTSLPTSSGLLLAKACNPQSIPGGAICLTQASMLLH